MSHYEANILFHLQRLSFKIFTLCCFYEWHNWMAWCKTDLGDFFGWNLFSFKSAWIIACAFQLSTKTFPCILFLTGLHFVSEKNENKISKHAQWMQQTEQQHFYLWSFASLYLEQDEFFFPFFSLVSVSVYIFAIEKYMKRSKKNLTI